MAACEAVVHDTLMMLTALQINICRRRLHTPEDKGWS